jgi:hypothetical protein
MSAIWGFLSVCTAILTGKKYIALSNETSANEPTAHYHGEPVNHQYSKTLEFERDFQAYVHTFISADIDYFSLLRPLTELHIAQIFCSKLWSQYRLLFSSCNRNFLLGNQKATTFAWCEKCPKCAFVFLLLAAFLPRTELLKVFNHNLFVQPELKFFWRQLLGLELTKPFECVGEVAEVKKAFILALPHWPEAHQLLLDFGIEESELKDWGNYDYEKLHEQVMPKRFYELLNKFIDQ